MPPKKKSPKAQGASVDDPPETLSKQSNGVKVAQDSSTKKTKSSKCSNGKNDAAKATGKQAPSVESTKNSSKKKTSQSNTAPKRRGSKSDVAASSSPPRRKKSKENHTTKPVSSPSRIFVNTDDDSSIEDVGDSSSGKEYPLFPAVGDEIAILCPPEPPHPEGWYAAVVLDVILHESEGPSKKSSGKSKQRSKFGFTLQVEWDGGGVEELNNPEWRMKGDEPDQHGRISHRDAKLRPYFSYWVNRLTSMNQSEQKLHQTRPGKYIRPDPNQRVEWIQCANPNCGKWRPLPFYLKSSSVLETCNNTWYCVLNSWDEATASCGAPQETGYMPAV